MQREAQIHHPASSATAATRRRPQTRGGAFFRAEGMRYGHFVWHWFVLSGTVCHFIAVLRYAGGA